MKLHRCIGTLALAFTALALPAQAQSKKEKATATAKQHVVTAVLAVSPDLLGGRLGLDLATARTPSPKLEVANETATRVASNSVDQIAYQAWKAGKKS